MPIDHPAKEMQKDAIDRIMTIAAGLNKNYRRLIAENLVDHLKAELNLDYARASNKMIFDKEIEEGQFNHIELAFAEPLPTVREFSKVQVPPFDLHLAKANFDFSTFLSKIEVIKTLSKVRTECDKLASSSIFAVNITKTVKLDEFEQIQAQSLTNMKSQLKDR